MAEFDVELFEQRLSNLKDTQEGIQQMSSWCLSQRAHHKKIVSSWLNVLKQVRMEHRLTLFYLANDVIQYSKRKNYEFVESWGTTLQKATTMVRDEKVRNKIFRIFKIWEEREIYSEEYLSDLNGLLSMNPVKKAPQQNSVDAGDEFQNSFLISNIRECVRLEKSTDKSFKNLPKAPNCDTELIKNNLKDRSHSDDAEREIDDYVIALEAYIKSLKSELRSRKSLIANIEQSDTFYTNQKGEVKVVVNAYKSFGNRMKVMKKKLDEITPTLPSPIPSPDIDAPSPEPDADIVLPDDVGFSTNFFNTSSNGYTSYMDGNLPFDINDFKRDSPSALLYDSSSEAHQPIEVISSRSEEKSSRSVVPQPVPPVSNYQISQPPANMFSRQTSNYGSHHNDTYNPSYTSDSAFMSNSGSTSYDPNVPLMPPPPMPPSLGAHNDDFNSTWDMDMSWTSNDAANSFDHILDTPVSPPHFEQEGVNSNLVEYIETSSEDLLDASRDVDHRQLHLPVMLLTKEKGRGVDIDHRNLISLTGSPGPKTPDSKSKSSSGWVDKDKKFSNSIKANIDIDYRTSTLQEVPQESSVSLTTKSQLPPLLPPPSLEPSVFPQLNDILSSPNAVFDPSMPPPSFAKPDSNANQSKAKNTGPSPSKNNAKNPFNRPGGVKTDNVESIDMEMSDEDQEDYGQEEPSELAEMAESEISSQEDISGLDYNSPIEEFPSSSEEFIQSPVKPPNFRPPLLQTPDFSPTGCWDNMKQLPRPNMMSSNGNNMIPGIGDMWKSPRPPGMQPPPQFRMPGGTPPFPRGGGFMPQHRNFSPNMKPNFRPPHIRSPRGSPFFNNNRGRGGGMRGMGPMRGNFRGKPWQ